MKTKQSVKGPLYGMVHVRALPGTPFFGGSWQEVEAKALEEAKVLAGEGMDGIIIENMHDVPYLNRTVGPEVTACMTAVAARIKSEFQLPTGLQILAGANLAALAAARAAHLDLVRVEGFVFGHLADEGYMDAQAGELLRYRRAIGAESIEIWADMKKKHSSHALTADVDLVATAQAARFFRADALIVTGASTGLTADAQAAAEVRRATGLPVVIGSGITARNLKDYFDGADAFIIGSSLKVDGQWDQELDPGAVRELVRTAEGLRRQ